MFINNNQSKEEVFQKLRFMYFVCDVILNFSVL